MWTTHDADVEGIAKEKKEKRGRSFPRAQTHPKPTPNQTKMCPPTHAHPRRHGMAPALAPAAPRPPEKEDDTSFCAASFLASLAASSSSSSSSSRSSSSSGLPPESNNKAVHVFLLPASPDFMCFQGHIRIGVRR